MTELNRPEVVQRLVAALHEEAEIAMTMTNTPQQLERFQSDTAHRRRRARILAAAAAVVAVGLGTYGLTALDATTGRRGHTQITHIVPKPHGIPRVALPAAPQKIPAAQVRTLHGPDTVGALALGSLWAMRGVSDSTYRLYRVSTDGSRVLSTLDYGAPSQADGPMAPFQAGHLLVLPASAHGHDEFLVLDATGRVVRSLPVPEAFPGAGDSTGAWAITGDHTIVHIDASGKIVRTLTLKDLLLTGGTGGIGASVSIGGGSLWLADSYDSAVVRVDPASGRVTGERKFPGSDLVQVIYDRGAVYVSTNQFDLNRVDATTMKVTATESAGSLQQYSWQFLTVAPDGSLWANPGQATVLEVDPASLHVLRYVSVQPSALGYHDGGGAPFVVGPDKVFIAINSGTMYSFPRS